MQKPVGAAPEERRAVARASPVLQFDLGGTLYALSGDGRFLLEAGGDNRFRARLWDVDHGAYVREIDLSGVTLQSVFFAGDQPGGVDGHGRIVRQRKDGKGLERLPRPPCDVALITARGDDLFVAGGACAALYLDGAWTGCELPEQADVQAISLTEELAAAIGTDPSGVTFARVWPARGELARPATASEGNASGTDLAAPGEGHSTTKPNPPDTIQDASKVDGPAAGPAADQAADPAAGQAAGRAADQVADQSAGEGAEGEPQATPTATPIPPPPYLDLPLATSTRESGANSRPDIAIGPDGRVYTAVIGVGIQSFDGRTGTAIGTAVPLESLATLGLSAAPGPADTLGTSAAPGPVATLAPATVPGQPAVPGSSAVPGSAPAQGTPNAPETGLTEIKLLPRAGRFLALTGGGVLLEGDLATGQPAWKGRLSETNPKRPPRFEGFSASGERVLIRLEKFILIDLPGWRQLPSLPSRRPVDLQAMLWNPQGQQLIAAWTRVDKDGLHRLVSLWPLSKSSGPRTLSLEISPAATSDDPPPEMVMGLSQDGQLLAVSGEKNVYLVKTSVPERYSRVAAGDVTSILFHPDGESLYTVDQEGVVNRWEAAGDEEGNHVTQYGTRVNGAAGSAEEGILVLALDGEGKSGPSLEVLSPERRQVLRRVKTGVSLDDLAVSPKGDLVAGSRFPLSGIRLWTLPRGVPRKGPGSAQARTLAFSADGRFLVFGDTDLRTWKVGSGNTSGGGFLANLPAELRAVAMSDSNRCVFTMDSRGEVGVYDLRGRRRFGLTILDDENWLVYGDNGAYAGTPGGLWSLRLVAGGEVLSAETASNLGSGAVWAELKETCRFQ